MRIQLLNPNTCAAMTEQMTLVARDVALSDTQIIASTAQHGPVSIESARDEAIAGAALLDEIQWAKEQGVDAHIIACFGDPSLSAAREVADAPVIGIAQAAFHFASLISYRFAVVTTMRRTIATAQELLSRYGFSQQCSGVYASDIPVLALEDLSSHYQQLLFSDCQKAIDDGAEAIVLGCAGMATLCQSLQDKFQIPVIDGVVCAVKLAESLNALQLKAAKRGQYAAAYPKLFTGRYQHWCDR
ncbi:aspartate/glutamate racemase family protein [Celerinatantimonas diazotrophica]|uniref:Allantoin racemase n=1 Tax=Celerinatantimonas diazotrophica TaxID=412034 RepID=A0A4R1J858_9GAMM|nr:aspartate/glutamate racemase family protein [Celerinatantimonas diazotrophica]TCK46753.1 allantoin racemase [Celerinatantimonas diazotrophica]CAG9295456.1 Hydantoin racemase [Celerinatantimonas diazotrophica]